MREPLALYIHWPFCKSKCPYCDFNSHVREKVEQDQWKSALLQELAWFAAATGGRPLRSIFFGGGTPSLMPPDTAAALIEAAKTYWQAEDDLEITLEANPTSAESAALIAFRQAGINRVSLGVQALNEEDLRFLGRQHSPCEALAAVELAAAHFPRYSFDLIYARPGQSARAWEAELREALTHARGHLSLYQLTIEENTAFHHAYHQKKAFALPVEDDAADLYALTQDIMEDAGMPAYEVSNHAIPGQESRHNLAYWTGLDYIGIGPGAHGRITHDKKRTATQTLKSPERWLESVQAHGHGLESELSLSEQERTEEWLMMRLRLTGAIPLSSLPSGVHCGKLPLLHEQGLIELAQDHFRITREGRMVLTALTGEMLQ